MHEEILRFHVHGRAGYGNCRKIPHSSQSRWCAWPQVILETFGLAGMKREKWKWGELVNDETVMLSLVFPVFHYGVGIEVPPLEEGGEGDLKVQFFSNDFPAILLGESLLFTLHIH